MSGRVLLVLAFLLTAVSVPSCHHRSREGSPQVATDVDNDLELGVQLVSGQLKVGEDCKFRIWLKNLRNSAMVLFHGPLGLDPIPGDSRSLKRPAVIEVEHLEIDYPKGERWRAFYGGAFSVLLKPSEGLRRKEFAQFCKSSDLCLDEFEPLCLPGASKVERELTVHIWKGTQYIDSGFFFDLTKFHGLRGALKLAPRPELGELEGRRIDVTKESKLIWQGSLYVFLKIPE